MRSARHSTRRVTVRSTCTASLITACRPSSIATAAPSSAWMRHERDLIWIGSGNLTLFGQRSSERPLSEVTYSMRRFFVGRAVAPTQTFEIPLATFQRRDLATGHHFDIWLRFDALDKVMGHGLFQTFAASQQPHLLDVARSIDGRLCGRISRADQRHFLAAAKLRLDRGGPVVHRRSFELCEVWHIKASIARAARHHDRASPQALIIANSQEIAFAVFNGSLA